MASSRMLHTASSLMRMFRLPSQSRVVGPMAFRRPLSTVSGLSSDSEYETDGYFTDSDSELPAFLQAIDAPEVFQEKESDDVMVDFKNDRDAARIRLELPGIEKQDLKLWFDKDAFNYEAKAVDDDFGQERLFEGAVDLPMNLLKVQDTKADLKNGVLKVVIPKLPLEERAEVFTVKVSE